MSEQELEIVAAFMHELSSAVDVLNKRTANGRLEYDEVERLKDRAAHLVELLEDGYEDVNLTQEMSEIDAEIERRQHERKQNDDEDRWAWQDYAEEIERRLAEENKKQFSGGCACTRKRLEIKLRDAKDAARPTNIGAHQWLAPSPDEWDAAINDEWAYHEGKCGKCHGGVVN